MSGTQEIKDNHGQIAGIVYGGQHLTQNEPKYTPDLALKYLDEQLLKPFAFSITIVMLLAAIFIFENTLLFLPWLLFSIAVFSNIICIYHKDMYTYKDQDFIIINKDKYNASDISDFRILNYQVTFQTPLGKQSFTFLKKDDTVKLKDWYNKHLSIDSYTKKDKADCIDFATYNLFKEAYDKANKNDTLNDLRIYLIGYLDGR